MCVCVCVYHALFPKNVSKNHSASRVSFGSLASRVLVLQCILNEITNISANVNKVMITFIPPIKTLFKGNNE